MDKKIKDSCQYIIEFLRNLTGLFRVDYFFSVSESWVHKFIIEYDNERLVIEHSSEIIEDFDVALNKNLRDSYFFTLESKIKFNSLIPLGEKGWLPNYLISRDFLYEKREWFSEFNSSIEFGSELTELLYSGLTRLNEFLESILDNTELEVEAINNDKHRIQMSINYYKQNGTLNDKISIETLSYLKASLLSEIIFLEKKKKSENLNRIKAEYDKKIYKLVRELRHTPFLEVKLPECIHEYNSNINSSKELAKQSQTQEYTNNELDDLLKNLDNRLPKKRAGAWETFHSNNPDRLSQSANSMVELLDNVIGLVIGTNNLEDYLKINFGYSDEVKWIEATRKWISETKSNLHRVKHHIEYKDKIITEKLLSSAESIIFLLLSQKVN